MLLCFTIWIRKNETGSALHYSQLKTIFHRIDSFFLPSIHFYSLYDPPDRLANAALPYPELCADSYQFHARLFLANKPPGMKSQ
jgi:hypothetical protein